MKRGHVGDRGTLVHSYTSANVLHVLQVDVVAYLRAHPAGGRGRLDYRIGRVESSLSAAADTARAFAGASIACCGHTSLALLFGRRDGSVPGICRVCLVARFYVVPAVGQRSRLATLVPRLSPDHCPSVQRPSLSQQLGLLTSFKPASCRFEAQEARATFAFGTPALPLAAPWTAVVCGITRSIWALTVLENGMGDEEDREEEDGARHVE